MIRSAALIAAGLLLAQTALADSLVGKVAALEGHAMANQRELAVGDAVPAGSVIRTKESSRVGIFVGDIYVQLDPQSALLLERDENGRVKTHLQSGRARIIDTRGEGDPGAIRVDKTTAMISGGDKEVYILSEKAGRYAMFCEWTSPLAVTRDPKSLSVDPGNCVLSKPKEPLYAAKGHDHQIPLLPLPADLALNDPATDHFDLADVGAGPSPLGFGGPLDPAIRERDPCDTPGSGCGVTVVEPPPDTGGCAPGQNCNPPPPDCHDKPPKPPKGDGWGDGKPKPPKGDGWNKPPKGDIWGKPGKGDWGKHGDCGWGKPGKPGNG
jgi:hypothetical protein